MRTASRKYKISKDVKDKLLDAINTDDFHKYREFGSNFFTTLIEEINSDDEAWDKKSVALARAIINEDVDGIFMALCGWGVKTLIDKANDASNDTNDISTEEDEQ